MFLTALTVSIKDFSRKQWDPFLKKRYWGLMKVWIYKSL